MRVAMLCALVGTAVVACASDTTTDDDLSDRELLDDGKADGWLSDVPQGTYTMQDPETGDVATLTIGADKRFHREIKKSSGVTRLDGKVKFTQGGDSRYIRFLKKSSGALVDRYAYELHGRTLVLRKVNTEKRMTLWADDGFQSVHSKYAGVYTHYGYGDTEHQGDIFDLQLHDNGKFRMTVHAVHACSAPGHSCPESWSDGYTGWTYIEGNWAERDGGVTLTPRNEVTGEDGWEIDLDITFDGAKAQLHGKDGNLELQQNIDVIVLFDGEHSATPEKLAGHWKVVEDGADDDSARLLWGMSEAINGKPHEVFFDAETAEFCEQGPNENHALSCGIFEVAGDPQGGARGMLYAYRSSDFTTLTIKSLSSTRLVLADDDFAFELERLDE